MPPVIGFEWLESPRFSRQVAHGQCVRSVSKPSRFSSPEFHLILTPAPSIRSIFIGVFNSLSRLAYEYK